MDSTILQIPLKKSLKNSASEVASEYGFSSLQELLRLVITKLSRRELVVSIQEPSVYLSKKNNAKYLKMNRDFNKQKNTKSYNSVDNLVKDLRS